MLTVIFGAGASFDSAPTYPSGTAIPTGDQMNQYHRPPRANDLFQDRPIYAATMERFRECLPIVDRLRCLKGETLEAALQDLQAEADHYPRGLRQLAAVRYYLQMIIAQGCAAWSSHTRGVTNYRRLLDQIERTHRPGEPVCIVTFNYDTLLEEALIDFDFDIRDFWDYTQRHAFYRIFKVHGSVNWAHILKNKIESDNATDPEVVAREWIRRAAELEFTDEYVLKPYNGQSIAVIGGRPAFPAIAIPVERGKTFECPPSQIEELKTLLPRTSKLLVIGWRATEEHFLELLKVHAKAGVRPANFHLRVVSGTQTDAEDARDRILRAIGRRTGDNYTINSEGFTAFMQGEAEKFLRSR
jgi:hypothetical protein